MLHQFIACEFPDDVLSRLERLAATLRVPVQAVIEEAVRRHLDEQKPEVPARTDPMTPVHPVQPLVRDPHGTVRFHANAIVCRLLEITREHGVGLNELAGMGFSNEDFEQFAQLLGYSLSGFGELSYVSDETLARAEAQPVEE